MTENTTASGAADRVNAYLDRRATMRGIDKDVIHGMDGPDFELTVSDLRALAASAPVAPTPKDWCINHSTGTPILTYKDCSVIESEQAELVMRLLGTEAAPVTPTQPADLTVWFGSLPESNGKKNWSAILHRKGATGFEIFDGFQFARSEHHGRVRYDADCMRHLIGELAEQPDLLAYDGDMLEPATLEAAPVAPTPTASKRLIGWRTPDYLEETADAAIAKNWSVHHDLLPIFEGDVHTKLATPQAAPVAPTPKDWCINHSTGTPILTYKDCSVIESEQAELVMRLLGTEAAPVTPAPQPAVPKKKPLPDLMMAAYHEAIGWNACVDAMNVAAAPKAAPITDAEQAAWHAGLDEGRSQARGATQAAPADVRNLLDYAMQIAHERELHVTGHKHDSEGATASFIAACERAFGTSVQPAPVAEDAEDAARWRLLPLFMQGYDVDWVELLYNLEVTFKRGVRAQAAQPEGGANANR